MLIYQRVASYDEYGEVKLIKFRFMLEPIPQRVLQTLAASSDVGLNQYRAWVKRMFGYTASDSHKIAGLDAWIWMVESEEFWDVSDHAITTRTMHIYIYI